jgi:hypothetical protein
MSLASSTLVQVFFALRAFPPRAQPFFPAGRDLPELPDTPALDQIVSAQTVDPSSSIGIDRHSPRSAPGRRAPDGSRSANAALVTD